MRALWLLLAAGCVHTEVAECADGRVCPPGTVCVVGGCAKRGGCGDGQLDTSEQCDDRNLMPGDGCSPSCTIEICGNGTIDPGEQCDDANAISHDGCSSGCVVEHPVWTQITAPGPTLRRGHVMAWDPDRGKGVLHGGTGSMVLGETWIWDGAWTRAADGPARTFHTMAWDRAGSLVLFGGTDPNGVKRAESFAWDGTQWMQLGGSAATGRFDHEMGPDVVPGQLVMYGGQGPIGINRELWRRDASGWQLVTNTSAQTAQNVRFTFDPVANALISTGGDLNAHDTFSWDGSTWAVKGEGLVRIDHVQDYDPARRRIVAFSGTAGPASNETDEFDGMTWTRIEVVGALPPARTRAAGFYDPIRHGLVIMGGAAGATFLDDTWVLRWESSTPDDSCDGTSDDDHDGAIGCADPDCWARCTPRCPPGAACNASDPHCGDGVCNPQLETSPLCPADC